MERKTTDRADPITRQLVDRVVLLRERAGHSQAEFGRRMGALRPGWTRTTVAKFEKYQRESISIADLFALAQVLDVPPVMLLADPRNMEQVPVPTTSPDGTPCDSPADAWDAFAWLIGAKTLDGHLPLHDDFEAARWTTLHAVQIGEALRDLEQNARVASLATTRPVAHPGPPACTGGYGGAGQGTPLQHPRGVLPDQARWRATPDPARVGAQARRRARHRAGCVGVGHIRDRWKDPTRKGQGKRWQVKYRVDGRERDGGTYDVKAVAQRRLVELESAVQRGQWVDPTDQTTVVELVRAHAATRMHRPRTAARTRA